MKKRSSILLSLFLTSSIFALEVNTSELRSLSDRAEIEFINYEGPHAVVNTAGQIRGIGSEIGKDIAASLDRSGRFGNNARYSVIHAVDSSVKEKLDADILLIGSDSQLDHINNLRRIISGYLSAAYNYSESDADTIAVFITVYNAVYRSDFDSFSQKYKTAVTDHLTRENCGLSVNYKDWAGKTEIVIPLYDVNDGGLSTIDTSVISDKNVVSSMKEDDDKNIESRKNLVDIKEREAENAAEKAKASQKQATEENKKLEEEKKKTEAAQKEADQALKNALEKEKIAENNPDDKNAQKDAEDARKEADRKAEELEEQKRAQENQAEIARSESENASRSQLFADRKETEAQSERKEIAKDQLEVQRLAAENDPSNVDYALLLIDDKKMTSKIVRYNKTSGKALKDSALNVIRSRQLVNCGDNFIAIAGENKGNAAVKLVLIDRENMQIFAESEEKVSENSILLLDGNDIYCVINEGGKYYLGKFDLELNLKMKSVEAVKEKTSVTIGSEGIAVTGSDGKIKILDKSDISSKIGM